MRRPSTGFRLALVALLCTQAMFAQSISPAAGVATIHAEIRQPDRIAVSIKNNRAKAIEAWAFDIVYDTYSRMAAKEEIATDAYPSLAWSSPVPDGVIAPGETKVILVPIKNPVAVTSVTLTLALYSDFSYDGDNGKRLEIFQQRERDAVELGAWIATLGNIRSQPEPQMKGQLQQKIAERQAATAASLNSAPSLNRLFDRGVQSTIEGAVKATEHRPADLPGVIDGLKVFLERQRELALRHLGR